MQRDRVKAKVLSVLTRLHHSLGVAEARVNGRGGDVGSVTASTAFFFDYVTVTNAVTKWIKVLDGLRVFNGSR